MRVTAQDDNQSPSNGSIASLFVFSLSVPSGSTRFAPFTRTHAERSEREVTLWASAKLPIGLDRDVRSPRNQAWVSSPSLHAAIAAKHAESRTVKQERQNQVRQASEWRLKSRSHIDVSRWARSVAHINDYRLVARWEPSWHDEVDLRYADQIIGDPDEAGLRLYWGVPDKDSHRL